MAPASCESFCGDGEDAAGLAGGVFVVGADGAGAGDDERCFRTRTAREKPMMGSKGELPLMFCRMRYSVISLRISVR